MVNLLWPCLPMMTFSLALRLIVAVAISLTSNDQSGLTVDNANIAAFLSGATATDAVDGALSVSHNAPATFVVGTTTVIFSATDTAGNVGSATSTVTVNFTDVAAPVVTAPASITLTTNEQSGLVVSHAGITVFLSGATATDTVDGALSVTYDAPATFPVGMTIVTFSATDTTGNTGTTTVTFSATDTTVNIGTAIASVTVNFVDAEAPVLSVPAAITLITNDQTGLAATKIVETQTISKLQHSVEQLEYSSKIQDTLKSRKFGYNRICISH
jgi:hypothetical protein